MMKWNMDACLGDTRYRVIDTDGSIQTILYENEPFLSKPTEVFAYIGVPELESGLVPGMVCVHGGGGKAFREWVEMWVERGYAAIAMDLSGRDGNQDRLTNGGPEQDHDAKFNTALAPQDMWTYHGVAAVMRANSILRGLPSVNAKCIGVTGISWGGYLTCISAGVDRRFACAIPVYGCGFLQHNSADDWLKIFGEMTAEERQAWHDQWDPSVYLGKAAMPMLFVSGTNDFAYPMDSLEMSCDLTRDVTRCVRREMGHSHEHGWAPPEISIFADHHLLRGTPLPTIGNCSLVGNFVRAHYEANGAVLGGHLVYTLCRGKWQSRKWHISSAVVTDTTVSADLPEGLSACFLAIEDVRGAYVNSACVMRD